MFHRYYGVVFNPCGTYIIHGVDTYLLNVSENIKQKALIGKPNTSTLFESL